jgi:hypothetical protein
MKTDLIHKFLKLIDHERGKIIGLIVSVTMVFCLYSCDVKLTSPISGEKVTAKQFELETTAKKVEYESRLNLLQADMQKFVNSADITKEEFAKWEEFRQKSFNLLSGIVTTLAGGGTVNISQVVASIIGVGGVAVGVGGLYDSKRKNTIIEEEKNKNVNTNLPA